MDIEKKLEAMEIVLPEASAPSAAYIPAKRLGSALFVAGHIPTREGKLLYTGKVGKDLTLTQAEEAARVCIVNILSTLKAYLGDLDRVKSIVKLQAFVSSETGFDRQHIVVNAASQLLIDLFGEDGRHARTAIGTNQLPMDAPVEIELIVEISQ